MSELNHPVIGIIAPLEDESLFLHKHILHHKKISIADIQYDVGKIANKDVVLVNSGLGKVNASAIATRLIRDFQPAFIILSGTAGNINSQLKSGDVIIGETVIDVDFGMLTTNGIKFPYQKYLNNPQTNSTLPLEFHLDHSFVKSLMKLNQTQTNLPKMILGKIATSDALPNQSMQIKLLEAGKFDVVDMESSSVMQVCWLFKRPCMVIRGISNHVEDPIIQQNIEFAADHAAKILKAYLEL